MRDINEINQLYIKARELCKRDIFDIEKEVNEKAILPLQDLKEILNNYLIDNPNNIIALRLMCFVECYLSDFNTAIIYLEKAVMLNGDNKDKFKLSKLAEIARDQNILMLDLKSMDAKQLNFHKKIKSIITDIKNELDKDPSTIIFAQFSSGLKGISRKEASDVGIYYDFLQISNGCRCGIIDLWDYDDLFRNKWVVERRQKEKKSLISIGQILYEPLILDTISGNVYIFSRDDDDEMPMTKIGDLEYFLINYVFGDKYQEIIPDYEGDEWMLFLKHNKIT